MKKGILGPLVGLFLVFSIPANAATCWDPSIHWQTLHSPHFRIHFAKGNEALAQHTATLAEEIHIKLAKQLKVDPPEPTSIVLADQADALEEDFHLYPRGTIVIPVTLPDSPMGLERQEDWFKLAIAHEYTHSLQGKIAEGLSKSVNGLLGRLLYPSLLLPFSMMEGLAVLDETLLTQGGRGREPLYQAILRCAALENRLVGLDQIGGYYTSDWPARYLPAAYGHAFNRYLVDRFGPETLTTLTHTFSSNPLLGLDAAVKTVTGIPLGILWEDCLQSIQQQANQSAEHINQSGITPSAPLTEGWDVDPLLLPDGSLLFARYDGHGPSKILLRYPSGLIEELFSSRALPGIGAREARFGRMSLSPDNRYLYFCALHDVRQTNRFSDLFRLEIGTGALKPLTHGMRLRDAALSPDGKRFIAVKNAPGTNGLVVLDSDGTLLQELPLQGGAVQISGLAWSPSGNQVVASVWHQGQRDLMLVSPDSGTVTPLWNDAAADTTPTWSREGRYVLFSSDRSGVFNVYALRMADQALFQITNVLGAALYPAICNDKLVFADYSSRGFGIRKMPFSPDTWKPVETPEKNPTIPLGLASGSFPVAPYRVLETFSPRMWAPYLGQDERGLVLGATAWGEDDLEHHQLEGQAGWGVSSQRPSYRLAYLYDRWGTTLGARIEESVPKVLNQSAEVWQRRMMAEASLGMPLLGDSSQSKLGAKLGYRYHENTFISSTQGPQTSQHSLFLSLHRETLYQSRYATGPEEGQSSVLSIEQEFEGAPHGRIGVLHRSYHPVVPHHVLGLKLSAGWAFGGESFRLGGSMQSFEDYGEVPLRGYPLWALSGSKLLGAGMEFRMPIWEIQRGLVNYPVYATRIAGTGYWEAATLFDSGQDPTARLKHTLGAELKLHGYALTLPLYASLGVGYGLSPGGYFFPYVGAGVGF